MYPNENSADHATLYFNAQLGALWENAVQCLQQLHRHPERKPESPEQRYSFALAEFWFGKHKHRSESLQDLMFHAVFEKPSLHFLCNHDVLLRLTIREGHYNTEFTRAAGAPVANHERNEVLQDIEVSLRIPYDFTGIRGGTSKIGNGEHVISLLVLDMAKAQLNEVPESLEPARQALAVYLSHYLGFLQKAGHHVLFRLPQFDDLGMQPSFDFSAAVKSFVDVEEMFGISVEKINDYLSQTWLNAAMKLPDASDMDSVDRSGVSLVEYRSVWSKDAGTPFQLKFTAPYVRALCGQEVLLYFTIEELQFYTDANAESVAKTFRDWKFAFLLNVSHEIMDQGHVTRCLVDFSSYQYMEHFSEFSEYDTVQDAEGLFARIFGFFTSEYFGLLESSEYHVIYHFDSRSQVCIDVGKGVDVIAEEGTWDLEYSGDEMSRGQSKTIIWKEITEFSDMGGFDMVTAISQTTINAQLHSTWDAARTAGETAPDALLVNWAFEDSFEANFQAITVNLLTHGLAIVFIHLEEGFVKSFRKWMPAAEGTEYRFEHAKLAFEVPLLKCGHEDLPGYTDAWNARFANSYAYKVHGQDQDCAFHHVYLDFEASQFLLEFSKFDGLLSDTKNRPLDKIQSMVAYLRDQYFKELMSHGYHVLYTMPVWKKGINAPPYALTDILFHVYSESDITRQTFAAQARFRDPVVVIVGISGDRPMPALNLRFTADWFARAGRVSTHGIVCVSSDIFLESKLLRVLSRANAETTMIPVLNGVSEEEFSLDLIPWFEHGPRRNQSCSFVLSRNSGSSLIYRWQHQEIWTYEHFGSSSTTKELYKVSCITENFLEVPTVFKHGSMEIKFNGSVKLSIGFDGADMMKTQWTARSSVNWGATLVAHSQAGGLSMSIISTKLPQFERIVVDGLSGRLRIDPELLLRNRFPDLPVLEDALGDLRFFEGTWMFCYPDQAAFTLANPVFNHKGDLLFELRSNASQGPSSNGLVRKGVGRQALWQWNGASPRNSAIHIRTAVEEITVDTMAVQQSRGGYSARSATQTKVVNSRTSALQRSFDETTPLYADRSPLSARTSNGASSRIPTPSRSRPQTPTLQPFNAPWQPSSRPASPHVRPGSTTQPPRSTAQRSGPASPPAMPIAPTPTRAIGNGVLQAGQNEVIEDPGQRRGGKQPQPLEQARQRAPNGRNGRN